MTYGHEGEKQQISSIIRTRTLLPIFYLISLLAVINIVVVQDLGIPAQRQSVFNSS